MLHEVKKNILELNLKNNKYNWDKEMVQKNWMEVSQVENTVSEIKISTS